MDEIVSFYTYLLLSRKNIVTRVEKLKWISRVPTWRGLNAKRSRDAKTLNRRRVPIAASRYSTSIQRRLAISSRIINRRDIDASLFCAERACLSTATVKRASRWNSGVCSLFRPRTLRMINVGQSSASGLPWPGYIASIRLLRTSPRLQPHCKLRRSPTRCSWHASPE